MDTSGVACWLLEWRDPIATVLSAIAAALIAPPLGLAIYRRQKQHEIVRERYLDNGLDVISGNAERALGVFRHNWQRGLNAIKHFRDLGEDMPRDLYKGGYIELAPSDFDTSHSFVLNELLGDEIYHQAQQLLYSFVANANTFLAYDLASFIRIAVEGGEEIEFTENPAGLIPQYIERCKKLDQRSNDFYKLLEAYYELSSAFARKQFTFQTVERFRREAIVVQRTQELRELFREALEKYEEPAP